MKKEIFLDTKPLTGSVEECLLDDAVITTEEVKNLGGMLDNYAIYSNPCSQGTCSISSFQRGMCSGIHFTYLRLAVLNIYTSFLTA